MAREVFLREFWACFRQLEDAADDMVGKAAYFRFLTLLGACCTPPCLFAGQGGVLPHVLLQTVLLASGKVCG